MASDLCIERNDSKWEIRDSPAKKQRCEDYGLPPPLCSSAEEEKEKEKEDPRSKVVFYNYDNSDVEDDSDGMHEFTDREYQEYNRQITESDGFDVMSFPRSFACGTTTPLYNLNEIADDLKALSELALKEYNEKEHTNLEFVKVVKANAAVCAGCKYYITFDITDAAAAVDGGTTEFQACVWDGIAHTEPLGPGDFSSLGEH
ncbi:hypothetical protein HYC85_028599 [Camellia sinensis]|uniref:Cystatin domain-containing protein n=1 Tax=Camellia sinensis TaxID=4442 RepID=A0A7J7FXT4_CAMSI|nr:hypothetical protein HYC85_028599 [Camellia sinensis]